jgi:RNA recognition motif-containing protein
MFHQRLMKKNYEKMFSKWGKIWRVSLPSYHHYKDGKPIKRNDTKHKGFGFVHFEHEEDAKKVLTDTNYEMYEGFAIMELSYAMPSRRRT